MDNMFAMRLSKNPGLACFDVVARTLAISYNACVWEIEATDVFQAWYDGLDEPEWSAVNAAVDLLAQGGPGLRRPLVGHIESSRHANMRELVVPYRNLRVLFAFDPRRTAILLLGGDKTDRWTAWYDENVPRADDLYDRYLAELKEEGLL